MEESVHEAAVDTPFRSAENCELPPAGTITEEGLRDKPNPLPMVRITVLDVTLPVLDELLVWEATAVTATSPSCAVLPHELVGTVGGAVYIPTN